MHKISRRFSYPAILAALFLQIFFSNLMSFGQARPNFLIIIVVFLALFTDERFGLKSGFISGLLLDIFGIRLFGFNILALSLCGYLIGKFNIKVYKESIITHAILLFIASFFILSFYRALLSADTGSVLSNISLRNFLSMSVISSSLYNAFLGSVIYTFLCRILKLGETTLL